MHPPGIRTWPPLPRPAAPQVTSEETEKGNLLSCFSAQKQACTLLVGEQTGVTVKQDYPVPSFKLPVANLGPQVSQLLRPWDHLLAEASLPPFCRMENGSPKREHESPRSQCLLLAEQRLELSSSWLPAGRKGARTLLHSQEIEQPGPGAGRRTLCTRKVAPRQLSEWRGLVSTIAVCQGCPL